MEIGLSADERTGLERAVRRARGVRQWRRYQAVLLLAEGETVVSVARALRASAQTLRRAIRRLG